jgi:hypothetical protein
VFGGYLPFGNIFGKFTQAEGHEFRNVLGMDEIGRELNDVRKGGARRFQRRLDVAKYLCRLGVEIALADDIAFGIARQRAGDEQELVRLHPRDMAVLPHRRAELLRIVNVDFCRHGFPLRGLPRSFEQVCMDQRTYYGDGKVRIGFRSCISCRS